jgi:hypothetical protein
MNIGTKSSLLSLLRLLIKTCLSLYFIHLPQSFPNFALLLFNSKEKIENSYLLSVHRTMVHGSHGEKRRGFCQGHLL